MKSVIVFSAPPDISISHILWKRQRKEKTKSW